MANNRYQKTVPYNNKIIDYVPMGGNNSGRPSSVSGEVVGRYVPDYGYGGSGDNEEFPPQGMGAFQRGIWYYTHNLGREFTLVLTISLLTQAGMACLIGLNGLSRIPIFQAFASNDNPILHTLAIVVLIVAGLFTQGLIIAEMAQVVWLRHPDKLKVRLMSDSIWWWIMLIALIVSVVVDFFLLFLAVTNTSSIADAFAVVGRDQTTGFANLLLAVFNLLTLLRCSSVMRTSTSAEIHREVEERLKAIAEEMLIDAGDSARQKASKIWKRLSVDPQRFLPIHNSVLNLISQQHPDIVPPNLGGDTWAYDFGGNTFAALPPDVHQALLHRQFRARNDSANPFKEEDVQVLWSLPPRDVAQLMANNFEDYGRPKFVDVTEPDEPRFASKPVDFSQLSASVGQGTGQLEPAGTSSQPGTASEALQNVPLVQGFTAKLPKSERVQFGIWLTNQLYPKLKGHVFVAPEPSATVFDAFDDIELAYYHQKWLGLRQAEIQAEFGQQPQNQRGV